MRLTKTRGRTPSAVLGERLRDERGIALVMALRGADGADSHADVAHLLHERERTRRQCSNADQKAFALAEAGLNNALYVLHSNYPGVVAYPGNPTLLPARTTAYEGGSAAWSGTLTGPLTGAWRYEWRITSTGTVQNPTGPGASPVTRTATGIVPVIIPTTTPTTGTAC